MSITANYIIITHDGARSTAVILDIRFKDSLTSSCMHVALQYHVANYNYYYFVAVATIGFYSHSVFQSLNLGKF